MKNFFKKYFFIFAFIFLFILIEVFQLTFNYKESIKPPSDKWSKGVLVSQGNIQTTPKIISVDDNYLIAHDDGNKINLILTDSLGKKLKEKTILTESNIIKTLILSKDKNDFYISWLNNKGDSNTFQSLKINKNLEEKDLLKLESVKQITSGNENIIILMYEDKIESLNLATKENIKMPAKSPSLLSSCVTDNDSLITYKDADNNWYYILSKNGEISLPKFIQNTKVPTAITFFNSTTNYDSKDGIVLIEYGIKDEINMFYLNFSLNDNKSKFGNLEIKSAEPLYNLVPYTCENELRFMGSLSRYVSKKNKQPNIVDFSVKDLNIKDMNYVSKTITSSKFPYPYKDTALYCEYVKDSYYNLYVTSKDENFKSQNNFARDSEKNIALSNTMYSLLKSISFVFTWGFVWLILGSVTIAIVSFFSFMMHDKTKKITYCLSYLITTFIKLKYVYKFTYTTYKAALPNLLYNPLIGLSIITLISILCFFWGYKKYIKDLDSIPASSFIIALIVDTIFTQMIFVPFVF